MTDLREARLVDLLPKAVADRQELYRMHGMTSRS